MEIGLIDIKGTLPCFENFGNLPTKIIRENNISEIKDLEMLIIPGGSIVESGSFTDDFKKQILDFDNYIVGICSGFQILSEKIDIGRKSPVPIVKEGLGLLNVEFSPLICTDLVKFNFENNNLFGEKHQFGNGFHCHTYGNIEINNNSTEKWTTSEIEKLNYKMVGKQNILSGVFKNKVYGTMVHNLLDNNFVVENFLKNMNIKEEEMEEIFKKNSILKEKLKNRSKISENFKNESNDKKGIILLATGSESGKTFLSTSICSKLKGKTFFSKIGPDVRDIVPSLYLLREPMTKFSSIKISDRGWSEPSEFLEFVKNSEYNNYIIEGVMGAFTGALNKKNYSGSEVSKILGFPVYIISSCSKTGIEGSFVECMAYYSLLKEMGINVAGIILNRVYNKEVFEKVKKIADDLNINVIGVNKLNVNVDNKRGLIPEVEIDYEEFCNATMKLDFEINIPKIDIGNVNEDHKSFEEYIKIWSEKLKNLN
ncbi:cobyrinate a,c-diamide synthase [Methanococcus maripaludis C5]|uniref:Cobyrinate a,c-diamide synthase n=1 Tax=Methanococcus maripaludis (strain C5 / ATCC BAA-1333) TaxID=402880 RepID=A4G0G6_METM5|nr:cobyrinic acid a,c-diamide synthase [Methanococcus maripaludis]ABO35950.1 cobyrinate a,c-diamide synthase [Methanococcus maripaludis C5]